MKIKKWAPAGVLETNFSVFVSSVHTISIHFSVHTAFISSVSFIHFFWVHCIHFIYVHGIHFRAHCIRFFGAHHTYFFCAHLFLLCTPLGTPAIFRSLCHFICKICLLTRWLSGSPPITDGLAPSNSSVHAAIVLPPIRRSPGRWQALSDVPFHVLQVSSKQS